MLIVSVMKVLVVSEYQKKSSTQADGQRSAKGDIVHTDCSRSGQDKNIFVRIRGELFEN